MAPRCGSIWKLQRGPRLSEPQGGDDKDQMGPRGQGSRSPNAPAFLEVSLYLSCGDGRWGQGCTCHMGRTLPHFLTYISPGHTVPLLQQFRVQRDSKPHMFPSEAGLVTSSFSLGTLQRTWAQWWRHLQPQDSQEPRDPWGHPRQDRTDNLMLLNKSICLVICIPSVLEMLLTPATWGIQGMHLGQGFRRA